MNETSSLQLTALLQGMRHGDQTARKELFARLYQRLVLLVQKVLHSFPAARQRHDAESVVHDLYIALMQSFDDGHIPEDGPGMLRFAAHRLRWLLLDEADRAKVRKNVVPLEGNSSNAIQPSGPSTWNPEMIARWTEFHQQVGALPEDQRIIVELHFYLGLSQADIAKQLDMQPKAVSRFWLAATMKLADYLPK